MQTTGVATKNFGAIKDHLKILSDDRKGFHPKALKDATGLNFQTLSRSTGVARARLYNDIVIPKPGSGVMIKIIHTVIALDEALELMDNNANDAVLWLNTANASFMGYSPFEVCMQGRGEEVINWLRVRSGKIPGAGF